MRQLSTTRSLLLWAALGSCESTPEKSATVPGASELLDQLAHSRQSWDALVKANGDDYSYAEENCVHNFVEQSRSLVLVEGGVASLAGQSQIEASECEVFVNRYNDFRARTLPQLYNECEMLARTLGDELTVSFDDRDILQACFETDGGNDSSCYDACGTGFYVRDVSFGTP